MATVASAYEVRTMSIGRVFQRSISTITHNPIGSAISAMVINLIWGTIQPSLYLELRQCKEGRSIDNLEQVFA